MAPKLVPKWCQKWSSICSCFWAAFWAQIGPKNGPKMVPTLVPKWGQLPRCAPGVPSGPQNGAKMCPGVPKWTQNGPKWLQNVTLEPEMDTKMEPTCLQGLPRGAPGAPSGANMHPKWDARGNELRSFCVSHHRYGPRPGGMREAIKFAGPSAHGV